MVKFWPTILTFALVFAAVGSVRAQNPERRGRTIAAEFCSRCHAVGKTGKSPHAGAPPFRTLGSSFDLDQFPRLLERGISAGHPDMPEFKFSLDDATALSTYLRTIQQ